ncbi:GGDEF domain-containing response regulator [Flocculibacter collagenilyticus]|uniref:GGDEF domain-containing response regulator n=1 Tax=Flocculibacter collagenilyticus TaxID=2744479 RepID=UPI0018F77274|nr:diguanylate cyclase [Flocculibacter collagenilyticus]
MITRHADTILIVDDEPTNIKVLGQLLSESYRVKTAIKGQTALDIVFSDDPPDLILLDIKLPDIDGYRVCQLLKHDERSNKIPIIFITGLDSPEDEAKGLALGAMDYIRKPFNLPIVMARVNNQMQLKRKTDMLEQLISIDSLTEIPNRRSFDQIIEKEWRRACRSGQPIAIIMMDIDHFKQFNDHYGHREGDDCLVKVAHALQENCKRAGDFIARYGGEEFVAILTETSLDDLEHVATGFKEAIQNLGITHEHSSTCSSVTISLGGAVAIADENGSYEALINQADKMLYLAKQQGRNRVVIAPELVLSEKSSTSP